MIQKHLVSISLITDMRLEIKGKKFRQMVFEEIVKPQTQGKSKIEMNKSTNTHLFSRRLCGWQTVVRWAMQDRNDFLNLEINRMFSEGG